MLLTLSNPKTAKSEPYGYLTAVLHLSPAQLSGASVCPFSTPGCRESCLNTAGHGGIGLASGSNPVQEARVRRTRAWRADVAAFMDQLASELVRLRISAARQGLLPAVRLNGTSDVRWEVVRCGTYANLMHRFPDVQFYDYTKWPLGHRHLGRTPGNYHLTFSLAEDNSAEAERALLAGHNVAVVFAAPGGWLPAHYAIGGVRAQVINGDLHDLRFLDYAAPDGRGVIVGLRAKGRAVRDTSGFVQHVIPAVAGEQVQ
jgi:hypothetical protein